MSNSGPPDPGGEPALTPTVAPGPTVATGGVPTVVLDAAGPGAIARAAALLAGGGLVAFPTETVYGLGADATSAVAVRRVFAAKGRPATDPLIVHVASIDEAEALGDLDAGDGSARRLAREFWPGPLTVVVPRRPPLAAEVGGGRHTVALRSPAHPVALDLIRAAGVPVAAPSANRFGRVSPTTAAHVVAELDGAVDLVLDGGPTPLGVESTVVACGEGAPRLLRPGGLTVEDLTAVAADLVVPPRVVQPESVPAGSPGVFLGHYAPSVPVVLVEGGAAVVGALAGALRAAGVAAAALALPTGAEAAARELYARLRELDAGLSIGRPAPGRAGASPPVGPPVILAAATDPAGLGRAVNDRLYRAAHGHLATDASDATVRRIRERLHG